MLSILTWIISLFFVVVFFFIIIIITTQGSGIRLLNIDCLYIQVVDPVKCGGNNQANPRFLQILLKQTVRQRPEDFSSISPSVCFTAATKKWQQSMSNVCLFVLIQEEMRMRTGLMFKIMC